MLSNRLYTSSEAAKALKGSGSDSAARQRLKRAVDSGKLWRSESLILQRNERLICEHKFKKSKLFQSAVRRIINKERRSLKRALDALERTQILLEFELARVLGAPVAHKVGANPVVFGMNTAE